jgi:hypothetical protein
MLTLFIFGKVFAQTVCTYDVESKWKSDRYLQIQPNHVGTQPHCFSNSSCVKTGSALEEFLMLYGFAALQPLLL